MARIVALKCPYLKGKGGVYRFVYDETFQPRIAAMMAFQRYIMAATIAAWAMHERQIQLQSQLCDLERVRAMCNIASDVEAWGRMR